MAMPKMLLRQRYYVSPPMPPHEGVDGCCCWLHERDMFTIDIADTAARCYATRERDVLADVRLPPAMMFSAAFRVVIRRYMPPRCRFHADFDVVVDVSLLRFS